MNRYILEPIVAPIAFSQTDTVTVTPPWYVQYTEYAPAITTYRALVNGEETFRAVHRAIAGATQSIDIICWGFQPSMYFIRAGRDHPCIGELLMRKAREGVRVRVLGWEMPLNTAGLGGEANLPGKGPWKLGDRAMQPSTDEQYAFDRQWFETCAVTTPWGMADPVFYRLAKNEAAAQVRKRHEDKLPAYASRGFSLWERAEVVWNAKIHGTDPDLSSGTHAALGAAVTHHQKTVLVDYEAPEVAVGFVMGHNTLDEYWDTDAHSAKNRAEGSKPAPNAGPRGNTPRQDISSELSGPILEHLHHNFATAWHKATGEDLMTTRDPMALGRRLKCQPGGRKQMAQILRTQMQHDVRDIEAMYLQTVNNASRFIYIENQYFRWPPLANKIKEMAANFSKGGRHPGKHSPLYLFVVTNANPEGIGAGTVNTHRMLESLGRADTMPGITKLYLKQQAEAQYQVQEPSMDELIDRKTQLLSAKWFGQQEDEQNITEATAQARQTAASREAELERIHEAIDAQELQIAEVPNLKIHVCSLVAPDSPPGKFKGWMPVYIHSKLMIIDDVFTTHGSANINSRSMQGDSELNIAHEWASTTQALRRRLWDLHTGGRGAQDDPKAAFEAWGNIIKENKDLQNQVFSGTPCASLVEFNVLDPTLSDLD